MAGRNIAAFGICPTQSSAEHAVDALRAAGFRNTDVSLLLPESVASREIDPYNARRASEFGVLGGALGWLAGVGALPIPGLGPFIAAGPIVAALAGLGLGGAVGGITGALVGSGIPEEEADRFEDRVKEGAILISILCDHSEWARHAREILERCGAQDISTAGETRADYAEIPGPIPRVAS